MAGKKEERTHPKTREQLINAFEKMGNSIQTVEPIQFRSTGILSLDLAFHGGLPVNRMVLWYGNKGTGKSTAAYLLMRQQMRQGYRCLLMDTEHSFDTTYAQRLSMDLSMLDVLCPENLEQMWNMMMMALESKVYKLIVLDTLAKISPATELAAGAEKVHMGLQPRINSQALRMWTNAIAKSDCTVLVLNQERTNMTTYGAPNTNPGGKAIEFESALTLYMSSQGEPEYHKDDPTLIHKLTFRFQIRKTKLFPPPPQYENSEIHLLADEDHYDINYGYELFYAAQQLGLLRDRSGAIWEKNVAFYQGVNLGNGQKQVSEFFEQPSEVRTQIEEHILQAVAAGTRAKRHTEEPAEEPVEDQTELGF